MADVKRSIRILHVINRIGDGGADRALTRLVNGLDPQRFAHTVLMTSGPCMGYEPLRSSVRLICSPHPTASPAELINALQTSADLAYDIIHGWVSYASVVASVVSAVLGLPLVLRQPTNMNEELRYYRQYLSQHLRELRCAFRMADSVVVPSPALLDVTRQFYGITKIKVIPNASPVPPAVTSDRKEAGDPFVLAFVGRLIPQKDPMVLLEALARLRGLLDWQLLVFGEGELCAAMRTFASEQGLADRIIFRGFQGDWLTCANLIDLFVLPTRFEGMSNTLLEAAAAGLPILTTDIPENRAILDQDVDCLMVPPQDSSTLAEAILTLASNPELRLRLGATARRALNRFSLDKMLSAYDCHYSRILSDTRLQCAL